MSVELLTLIFFGSLLFFLLVGAPLTFVLGGLSTIFLWWHWGDVAFYLIASKLWDSMTSFTLVAIPLFVFMAMLLERSGVAHDLYRMMHLWWGGLHGGLAIGTVVAEPLERGFGLTMGNALRRVLLDAAMAACDELFEIQKTALELPYPGELPVSGEPPKKAFGS